MWCSRMRREKFHHIHYTNQEMYSRLAEWTEYEVLDNNVNYSQWHFYVNRPQNAEKEQLRDK